jgi:hypothetical protein
VTPRTKKAILLSGGVLVVVIVALGVYLMLPADPLPSRTAAASTRSTPVQPAESATEVADKFLAAFQTGNATAAAAVLDRDGKPFLVWQGSVVQPADPGVAPLLTSGMTRVAGEQGGKDGWRVVLIDAAGTELERLAGADGVSKPITTTLSITTQRAAQAAVDSASQPAMLVAIEPSTGEILAVAQNAASGSDAKALHGLYPPGSTFKIATATAVLEAGAADINDVLPCPGEVTVGTRTIPNDDHFALGDVPLHTAFARSCNTTFAQLAGGLGAAALSDAASQLGPPAAPFSAWRTASP